MDARRSIPFSILIVVFLVSAVGVDAQEQLWVGPNVNMVSGTTWPDGDPFLQRQNEPSIAVSTRDTMRLVGFTNDYRSVDLPGLPMDKETGDAWLGVYKSSDGGMTWRSTLLPGYPQDIGSASPTHGYEAGADPVVRAGTHGLFYLTGIVFDRGDPARSALFMTRYMDLDNRESGDPIEFIDTGIVKANPAGDPFIDKPWMAVDIPRAGAQTVQLEVFQDGNPVYQNVQCGIVYLAWAEIFGTAPNQRSTIMFSRSSDCGTTWSNPVAISAPDTMNQGVSMAVSPGTGDVWVAWRQFETDPTYMICASGGGYWKTHPEMWPLEEIAMGGMLYTKAEAIDILERPKDGDATFIVAKQLIPAKLNATAHLLVGELQDLIDAADAWLVAHPLGSKPTGAAKSEGLVLKDELEAFNNGEWTTEGCTTSLITPGTGNAIVVTRSTDAGSSFAAPTEVSTLLPFEQATTAYSFRTNAYPTITVDNAQPHNRAYIAWATRGLAIPRIDDVAGDARIVVSTSTDGLTWSLPTAVDQPEIPGHQIVPSINFAGGKVVLVYYDLRRDASGVFDRFIADFPVLTAYRHTVDVRAASADPADDPVFTLYNVAPGNPSDQVSRYLFLANYPDDPEYEDIPDYLQMKFNPPNLTIYLDGTRPFFGDYVDVAASPAFLPNPDGSWRYNTEPGDGAIFHTAWTDNRDIEAPHDGNWSNYVVPGDGHTSVFNGTTTVPECSELQGDEGQTKIRDQNTYTARLTSGLFTGSPGGSRPIGALQRAFVVTIHNDSEVEKTFRLTVTAPVDVTASFEQFSATPLLDLHIAPYSGATRTVFVTSPIQDDQRSVTVEVAELGGSGLTGSVLLNGDPTSPPPTDAGLLTAETYTPAMMNRTLDNPAMMNPAMMNLAMMNLAMMNPAMMNLAMMNPAMMNPAMMNPAMMNPAMMNPAMMNTPLDEITWELKNDGTTTAGYSFNLLGDGAPDPALGEFIYQLFIYREYRTPAADGCELVEAIQQQALVNVLNPEILDRSVPGDVDDFFDPDNPNTALNNPTFYLDPDETAFATLVIVDLDPLGGEDFGADDVWAAVVAQAVDTEDAANGETEPDYDTDFLIITTTSLPDATAGVSYSFQLTSTDGLGAKSWAILPGPNDPPGTLTLSGDGVLSGTVTAGGTYAITVEVSDGYESDETTLTLQVNEVIADAPNAPAPTPIGGLVATPVTVLVTDGNGDPLLGYQVTVQLASHPNGGTAHNNVATTDGNGVATFGQLWFDRTGIGYELTAEVALDEGVAAVAAPSDSFDVTPLVVTTTADDGPGSLRRCIENAERNVGYHDTVSFATTGPVPHTIAVASPLPNIFDSISIDGTSHPLYVDAPVVYVDGAGAGLSARGLSFYDNADNSETRGLGLVHFDWCGVFIQSASNVVVEDNYLGTDGTNTLGNGQGGIEAYECTGASISGNLISGNDVTGVILGDTSGALVDNNRIGTDVSGTVAVPNGAGLLIYIDNDPTSHGNTVSDNLISGNVGPGVTLAQGAHDNTIAGNFIGTDVTGTLDLGNDNDGVLVNASSGNTIGGPTPADRNVISGNSNTGVTLYEASGNSVIGNFVGTDVGGTNAVGNTYDGIRVILTSTSGNTISNNLVSGNGQIGVTLRGGAHDNTVVGNLIGTDHSGNLPLPNAQSGVVVHGSGSTGNTIGGPTSSDRNVVSGNGNNGVEIYDASETTVLGNLIGTDVTGTVALGNASRGVLVWGTSSGNTVGGPDPGDGNTVSGNGAGGIHVTSSSNRVEGNFVGTDITGTSAITSASHGIALVGSASINNEVRGNVASGNANGIALLGGASTNQVQGNLVGTDLTGTAAIGNLQSGIHMQDSGTEFNQIGGFTLGQGNVISGNIDGIRLTGGCPYNFVMGNRIGTTADGTAALGNANAGIDIRGGAHTNFIGGIAVERRNLISGNTFGVLLDGAGDSNVLEGNFIGTDFAGASSIGNTSGGIVVQNSANSTFRTNLISGNTGTAGMDLRSGTSGMMIVGNLIGIDGSATMTLALPNHTGIRLDGGAQGNTIGIAGFGNVIAGNNNSGIQSPPGSAILNTTIEANWIGTNWDLDPGLGNLFGGIRLQDDTDTRVENNYLMHNGNPGGWPGISLRNSSSALVSGNVASGNTGAGIILGGNTSGSFVQNNRVGTSDDGLAALGNGSHGIHLYGTGVTLNFIENNLVSGNAQSGISIDGEFLASGPYQNTARGNTVGLAADGVTPIPNQTGVLVAFGAYNNIIGGIGPGNPNIVAGNAGTGIAVGASALDTTAIGNPIISNSIFGNGGLGIDLSSDGITANDGSDIDGGGNDQLNFPVLTSAVFDGTVTNVTGNVHSLPGISLWIQFFTSPACDPSGNGEGQTYLGQVLVATDLGGNAPFSVPLATGPGGQITATSSTSNFAGGHTSEFSACVPVT